MPFFYAWETVDFPIQIKAEDGTTGILTGLSNLIITMLQGSGKIVEKDLSSPDVAIDTENDIINLHLTQEDTGTFTPEIYADIQVNFFYDNSERDTTAEAKIFVKRNLHAKVME